MTINCRSMVLWGSLVATAAASIWAVAFPQDEERTVSTEPSTVAMAKSAAPALPAAPVPASTITANETAARRTGGSATSDVFAAYSWEPPKPVAAPVKEPVQAPALPFAFAGRLEAGGPPSYILSEGGRMHVVAVGEQVGEFVLQQADAGTLVFLHVPTRLTATLTLPR